MLLVIGDFGFIGGKVVVQLVTRRRWERGFDDLSEASIAPPPDCDPATARTCVDFASLIGRVGYFHKLPACPLSDNKRIYWSVFEVAAEHHLERMRFVSSPIAFESTERLPSCEDALCVPGRHFQATFVQGFPSDGRRSPTDAGKARHALEWEPPAGFDAALREFVRASAE